MRSCRTGVEKRNIWCRGNFSAVSCEYELLQFQLKATLRCGCPAGSPRKPAGCCGICFCFCFFPEMCVTLRSQKMLDPVTPEAVKQIQLRKKKSGKNPTTKETRLKGDASRKCPAVYWPPDNTVLQMCPMLWWIQKMMNKIGSFVPEATGDAALLLSCSEEFLACALPWKNPPFCDDYYSNSWAFFSLSIFAVQKVIFWFYNEYRTWFEPHCLCLAYPKALVTWNHWWTNSHSRHLVRLNLLRAVDLWPWKRKQGNEIPKTGGFWLIQTRIIRNWN